MNRPVQLLLRLSPPPDSADLPADVVQQVLEAVAELLLQVQEAEDELVVAVHNATEVADERRS